MSATEGFWPGEAPPAAEDKDVQEPDATVAEPEALGWPQPHARSEPERGRARAGGAAGSGGRARAG